METTKLTKIIDRKNERLEEEALNQAAHLIEAIARQQRLIVEANDAIAQHRKELAALQVEQLDPIAILG